MKEIRHKRQHITRFFMIFQKRQPNKDKNQIPRDLSSGGGKESVKRGHEVLPLV